MFTTKHDTKSLHKQNTIMLFNHYTLLCVCLPFAFSASIVRHVIRPVDHGAIDGKFSEDLSMHSLGSPERRRIFQVHVGVILSDRNYEWFHSISSYTQSTFEKMDIELPGVGSFHLKKTDELENHWTGTSTNPDDYSEMYMKYDPTTNDFLALVNAANGDILKVNTHADGSQWMSVLLQEVSFVGIERV